jgi:hypothetical protein
MNFEDIIDSEIKRIKNTYVKMDGKYRLSDTYMYVEYNDLLRADGALRELEELKRKIHDNT